MTIEFILISVLFSLYIVLSLYDRTVIFNRIKQLHQEECARFTIEREKFISEREMLLNRIQSESYRDYMTQQIKMTKAQNGGEPEQPPYELL